MKIRKQKGLTLISFVIVLAMVLFVAFIGMKIGPIYLEYGSVVSAMNGVASERGSANLSPFDIRVKIHNRMYVSNTNYTIKDNNMKVIRGSNGVMLRIVYEVREPVIGNLDVVAKFDRSVRLAN